MDAERMIACLARGGPAVMAHCKDLTDAELRWRPAPGKWSPLEILCHLLDEERDDFRLRLRSTLDDPAQSWPGIDPEAWARDRDYRSRDFMETLGAFATERRASLGWLRGLEAPDWDRAYEHPSVGTIRAGDLLAAWAAHDLLHLRQLATTRLAWLKEASAPFSTRYADP